MAQRADRLRVAVIGAGAMGAIHVDFWGQLDGVEVTAVADVDKERAQALAAKGGVDFWTTEIPAAIDRPDVDIVSVCVPASFHAQVVLQALESGKHVLSEKPIARTMQDADRIVAAAAAAAQRGIKYTVSFQRRYLKIRQKQAELIQGGALGRPVMMQSTFMMPIRPKLAMHALNINGGPAVDFGVHQYDYWRTQFDAEPVQVMARGLILAEDRPELAGIEPKAPDTVSMTVTFDSGDIGVMTICWGVPPGTQLKGQGELIMGPKGILTQQGENLVLSGEGGQEEVVAAGGGHHIDLFKELIACIREDKEPWITAEDGRAALQIATAALESVATGRAVDLKPL